MSTGAGGKSGTALGKGRERNCFPTHRRKKELAEHEPVRASNFAEAGTKGSASTKGGEGRKEDALKSRYSNAKKPPEGGEVACRARETENL